MIKKKTKYYAYIVAALLFMVPIFIYAQLIKLSPEQIEKLENYIIDINSHELSDGLGIAFGRYDDVLLRISDSFHIPEVRSDLVRKHEQYYSNKSEYFNRTLDRSSPFLHYIAEQVEKRKMPGEIALLPFIESAFVTKSKSHVGATGIWQFMAATGQQYGLSLTNLYDGRNDFYAATDAALDYLEYLYSLFNDWPLALAAYNAGENRVLAAMKKAKRNGLNPTFENLSLPNETKNYVPKLLAVRNLIQKPNVFNIQLKKIRNSTYLEAIKIDKPIALKTIAQFAGITEEEVARLNPGYKIPIFIPSQSRKLLLPKTTVNSFQKNYKSHKNNPDSWFAYKLESTEHISDIANKLNIPVHELKELNNLKNDKVTAGNYIFFNAKNKKIDEIFLKNGEDNLIEKVNLTTIISIFDAEQPINLKSSRERRNTTKKLTYVAGKSHKYNKKSTTLVVKKGMNLNTIAKNNNMTVAQLKKINRLKSNHLKVGQNIKVSYTPNNKKNNTKAVKTNKKINKNNKAAKNRTGPKNKTKTKSVKKINKNKK